jgi:phage N-6-adenine-methyltransferase
VDDVGDQVNCSLVKYDAACRAVAEARSVDEVKDILNVAAAMTAYAKQANNKQMEADAFEIRMRATRRIDEMRRVQAETVGLNKGAKGVGTEVRVDSRPTLAEAGIDKHLADRARKIGRLSDDEFEKVVKTGRDEIERVIDKSLKKVRGTQGTGENEWYTPPDYIELARRALGGIDLDPASSDTAQAVVQADSYFTIEDDGLQQMWRGRVWLNPPYAQPYIEQFVSKLVSERCAGRVDAAILLTHNYTDTAWFQEIAEFADAICFTRGRVRFYNDNEIAAPTQGQAFSYFGTDVARFADAFADVGFVMVRR